VKFVPVELSGAALVLHGSVRCGNVVLAEESHGICVSSELHLTQLLPCPVVVKLRRPDESKVDSQASVDAGAIDAYEDAIGDAGPSRILCVAVETDFVGCYCAQSFEDLGDLRLSWISSHGSREQEASWRSGEDYPDKLM